MKLLHWLIQNSKWVLNEVGAFSVTHDFTANTVISSSQMNANFADVETAINDIATYIGSGDITNAMLAAITTAGKVSGAALTGLANVPSGGGILPVANGGTEFDSNDICLSSGAKDEAGWTEITSTYANKYLRVGSTGLATGGASTHTHGVGTYAGSGTTTVPVVGEVWVSAGSSYNVSSMVHYHTVTVSITGTSAAGNNAPLYVDLRLFQKS